MRFALLLPQILKKKKKKQCNTISPIFIEKQKLKVPLQKKKFLLIQNINCRETKAFKKKNTHRQLHVKSLGHHI